MADSNRNQDALSRRCFLGGVPATDAALGRDTVAPGSAAPIADLALVNGRILTMDEADGIASAMAIRDGRIVAVGSDVGPSARTIDLKGATVIPGLIDAHNHIFWAFSNPGHEARDIELARSMRQFLAAISDTAAKVPPGEFVTCHGGWKRNGMAENRLPTLQELDAAAPLHPVWVAESQTEQAWIEPDKYPTLPGVTNSLGKAFFEQHGIAVSSDGRVPWVESLAALQGTQTQDDRRRSIDAAIDFAVGHGVTMIHDFGDSVARGDAVEPEYPFVLDLWRAGNLKLRFRLRLGTGRGEGLAGLQARMASMIHRLGDDVLRLNGFGEGLPGRTAAEFEAAAKLVAEHGWSAHVHSVSVEKPGDTAQHRQHIDAYRAAHAQYPLTDLRWSLAHGNYLTPAMARELVEMSVGVTGEAWSYDNDLAPVPMGPPFRMLLDAGVKLGAGSDGTGTAGFNPWITIYYMTTGRLNTGQVGNPGQTVSRMEALKIHTMGSAWHSFDESEFGSIEVGKVADIAVLSADPLTVSDENLLRITSILTLQAGRIVHQA